MRDCWITEGLLYMRQTAALETIHYPLLWRTRLGSRSTQQQGLHLSGPGTTCDRRRREVHTRWFPDHHTTTARITVDTTTTLSAHNGTDDHSTKHFTLLAWKKEEKSVRVIVFYSVWLEISVLSSKVILLPNIQTIRLVFNEASGYFRDLSCPPDTGWPAWNRWDGCSASLPRPSGSIWLTLKTAAAACPSQVTSSHALWFCLAWFRSGLVLPGFALVFVLPGSALVLSCSVSLWSCPARFRSRHPLLLTKSILL